jgi:hypothetical protein
MNLKNIIFALISFLFLLSCSNSEQNHGDSPQSDNNSDFKNLNLTILIDLSDRISVAKNPEQSEKDIEIIVSVLENFKKFLSSKGVIHSEDRIKVIFYPVSQYDIFKSIADSLSIDFATLEFSERKLTFELLISKFKNNLKKLYAVASKANSFPGSDLFNYFKHRIIDDCIIPNSNFINTLVILTDGYIYYENSKYQLNNRVSYLAPKSNQIELLRNVNNWEEHFHKNDFGLIKIENDLSDLNILLCEFNPIYKSPKDFDIMKLYWSKWLEEQKIKKDNYKIIKTELTSINKNLINTFFENIFRKSYVN